MDYLRLQLDEIEARCLSALAGFSDAEPRGRTRARGPADWVLELDVATELGYETFDMIAVDREFLDAIQRLRNKGLVRKTSFPVGDSNVRLTILGVEIAQELTGRVSTVSGRGVLEDTLIGAVSSSVFYLRRSVHYIATVPIRRRRRASSG